MPTADAAALFRRNGRDPARRDRPALHFEGRTWTHAEYLAQSCRYARLFLDHRVEEEPLHVGVLLDNVPEYLFALGGAALSGAAIVGINHTRRDEHLVRDIEHTRCVLLLTEARHELLLDPVLKRLPFGEDRVLRVGGSLEEALGAVPGDDPGVEPGADTRWALVFTSGTSDAPKAVICSQRRLLVTGNRMSMVLGIGPDDVGYVCMPLFHSNALMVGWMPAMVQGASVGLARRFSASGWLPDVRRYGATYFSYTGKPLAYVLDTPARTDDADNPLRVAFGNEGSPELVAAFARRFDVEMIDAYGSTEGGVAVDRDVEARPGALGVAGDSVRVVDPDGNPLPAARFDAEGRLTNADECVGEIVNTAGTGPFEGYWDNDEANAAATRFGWYWTGDLGYLDEDRYLYFAGRNADWIRVDGENFLARPIEDVLTRHPDVLLAAVYGVPDAQAGDQVMAALVPRPGVEIDPDRLATWIDTREELGPKWRPRYVRVLGDVPDTGTNKIVKRRLVHEKFRSDRVGTDPVYVRGRGEDTYRRLDAVAEARLAAEFDANGRHRFWDL